MLLLQLLLFPLSRRSALLECFSVLPLSNDDHQYDHQQCKRFVAHRTFNFSNPKNVVYDTSFCVYVSKFSRGIVEAFGGSCLNVL